MKFRKSRLLIILFFAIICTGCTSASLRLEDSKASILNRQKLPVKFKFSTTKWNTTSGLPAWFSQHRVSTFMDNIKRRAPDLFSDDSKAIPMTVFFNHTRKNTTNSGLAVLSCFTLFVFPAFISQEDQFEFTVKIGEKEEYVETFPLKIYERSYLSIIPFFAFLLPPQSGYFCHGFVDIGDNAVNHPDLQNAFLNMIYRLDKDKLRKIYDEKNEEPVELL